MSTAILHSMQVESDDDDFTMGNDGEPMSLFDDDDDDDFEMGGDGQNICLFEDEEDDDNENIEVKNKKSSDDNKNYTSLKDIETTPEAVEKIYDHDDHTHHISVQELQQHEKELNEIRKLTDKSLRHKGFWKMSVSHLQAAHHDCWQVINDLPTEHAKRYRYNARKGTWTEDDIQIKIETKPFNKGAMRECFRAKKLSNFSHSHDWSRAVTCVVKRYMDEVPKKALYEDVRLQLDAKLWGEEYNKHQPPKKVDIMQMSVIEMYERPGSPLFHLENFIEGNYVKYNSNSGFVHDNDDDARCTPQAFSHFTFEASQHKLIVVDIQGVGDLWTDPQIHTYKGTEYGDGNLGVRGMALFFVSHTCNRICRGLNLSPFDLSDHERSNVHNISAFTDSGTRLTGDEEPLSPMMKDSAELFEVLKGSSEYIRSHSDGGNSGLFTVSEEGDVHSGFDQNSASKRQLLRQSSGNSDLDSISSGYGSVRRMRTISELSDHNEYREMIERLSDTSALASGIPTATTPLPHSFLQLANNFEVCRRASCVTSEAAKMLCHVSRKVVIGRSILGKVHYAIAVYYDLGRFPFHEDSVLFHLETAAKCGSLEAILLLAHIYMAMPHDVLTDIQFEKSDENALKGFQLLEMAADAGDRNSILVVANAYHDGIGLPNSIEKDYRKSLIYFDKLLYDDCNDAEDGYDCVLTRLAPAHEVLAKQAQIYLDGGHGVDKNVQKSGELFSKAAESATNAQKGRLANKYYARAEEVWALLEDD